MDSIVFALIVAVGIVIFLIWLKGATMRLNKKLKKEGKEPIPEQEIVNVGDSGKTDRPFRFSGTLNPLETEQYFFS